MKRRQKAVTVTPEYMAAWAKLFARSPEEIQAEKQARQPSPSPRTPNAQEAPKSALQRTQKERTQ